MSTKYRIHFSDGRQATMLDMQARGLAYARESVAARFGAQRIAHVEEMAETTPTPRTQGITRERI